MTLPANMSAPLPAPPLRRRFLCMIYESLLLFAIVFVADYLFDTLTQSRQPEHLRAMRQLWLFAILGVYFVWFWTHSGQTLAMKTWRIRAVAQDGRPLSTARAMLRYLLCWLFLLPALGLAELLALQGWAALGVVAIAIVLPPFYMKLDADGQFIHDRLARTRLVAVSA